MKRSTAPPPLQGSFEQPVFDLPNSPALSPTLRVTFWECIQAYGLDRAVAFSDVTRDADLAELLSDAYGGDIDNLDAYTGALAERVLSANGGVFGELLHSAWREQLYR